MRRIKILLAVFLIASLFVVAGCGAQASLIDTPDKIILYNRGNNLQIIKGDKQFDKIVELTNERFTDTKNLSKSGFGMTEDDKLIQKAAWQCIEFIYSKPHEFKVDGAAETEKLSFKYRRLFFLISADDEQDLGTEMKYGDETEFQDSIVGLAPNSELLKIIQSEVK